MSETRNFSHALLDSKEKVISAPLSLQSSAHTSSLSDSGQLPCTQTMSPCSSQSPDNSKIVEFTLKLKLNFPQFPGLTLGIPTARHYAERVQIWGLHWVSPLRAWGTLSKRVRKTQRDGGHQDIVAHGINWAGLICAQDPEEASTSMVYVWVCTRPSAYVFWLLAAWCLCKISYCSNRCVSDSFASSLVCFPPFWIALSNHSVKAFALSYCALFCHVFLLTLGDLLVS